MRLPPEPPRAAAAGPASPPPLTTAHTPPYRVPATEAQLDVCHDNESTRMLTTAFRLMDVASLITGGEDKAPVK